MSVEEVSKKIDDLVDNQADRLEIFEIVKTAMEDNGDNIEIVWRWARAHFMLSEDEKEKEKKYKLLKEGQKISQKCIEMDKDHYAG